MFGLGSQDNMKSGKKEAMEIKSICFAAECLLYSISGVT